MITLTVNGQAHQVDVDPDTPLLYVLRNDLGLNGAKFGCGLGQCGACTVLRRRQAGLLLPHAGRRAAASARCARSKASARRASPAAAAAFMAEQAAQCGYCIAGMIMRAQALLERNPRPTEDEIRAATWRPTSAAAAPTCASCARCAAPPRLMGGGVRDVAEQSMSADLTRRARLLAPGALVVAFSRCRARAQCGAGQPSGPKLPGSLAKTAAARRLDPHRRRRHASPSSPARPSSARASRPR